MHDDTARWVQENHRKKEAATRTAEENRKRVAREAEENRKQYAREAEDYAKQVARADEKKAYDAVQSVRDTWAPKVAANFSKNKAKTIQWLKAEGWTEKDMQRTWFSKGSASYYGEQGRGGLKRGKGACLTAKGVLEMGDVDTNGYLVPPLIRCTD